MATILTSYGSWSAITCTTTSLATDSALLAGRQSTVIDNSTTLAIDAIVGGTIATTATSLAAGVVEVWVGARIDGTNFTYNAGATDANLSLATSGVKSLGYLAAVIQQTDTSARTYDLGFNLVKICGFMPDKWFIFVVHNTVATLGATTLKYSNITYTNA